MTIPVTRTKIVLPRRRPDLLTRQRLVDILYELLEHKLIVVAAPAGYGKTSLLIDFAHQVDLAVCWYALDGLDRDLQRFLTHFIAAIAQRFPSFGKQSAALLEVGSSLGLDMDRLIATLVNEAYEHIREHFLLILDDYHLVNDNKEIDNFLNRFIQEIGENCHLILSSRTLLTLPDVPLLVARSEVGGLSFEELAFQSSEIKELFFQNYRVAMPDSAAEELTRETEGWITGLLLSAQTMWKGMANQVRVARVSGVGLYDYLAQQVLDQQPPPVRDFLLRTSILEEFDSQLCDAVLKPGKDWTGLIDDVLQGNLFVLPVGDDGRSIRYHHLFRDFLQARLEQECPKEKIQILRRLAQVYVDRGEWEKAYATYQRLADVAETADLIERAGTALIKSGRIRLLAQWIDQLPGQLLTARPNLLSLRGVADIVQGQVDRGLDLLNRSEKALRSVSDNEGLAFTLVRRAIAYRFLGKYELSLKDASEALALVVQDNCFHTVQAEACRASGMSLYQMGRLEEALQQLNQSLETFKALGDSQNVAMVSMELGLVSMSAGSYRQALSSYQQALDCWREVNNAVGQANLINNLGVLYHLMGNYEQAIGSFEEALKLSKQTGYTRMEAYLLCSIGDLYADLRATEAAQEAYSRAREIARQIDYRFLILYANLGEAAQARLMGNYAQAHLYLKNAEGLILESGSDYEQSLWQLEAGRLRLAQGNQVDGTQLIKEGACRLERSGQRVEAARAYLYLAAAYHQSGEWKLALAELMNAFRLAEVVESQHVLVVPGMEAKDLLSVAAKNPASQLQAAKLLKNIHQFESEISSLRRCLRPRVSAVPFAPPKLSIQAFNRAIVEIDGIPVDVPEWQNQKRVREFFYCLLAHPDGLTKEAIGIIFWPDSSPAQLKLQFKNTIYRLRCALGQDVVLYDDDRYWFNRDLDYHYDVDVFSAHLEKAVASESIEEKISAYRKAVDMYRGAYLPEMSGSWVWPERERLRQAYEQAVLKIAHFSLETEDYNTTIAYCQRILLEDNCLEEAHRLAMRAHAGTGNRAALMRQFQQCRQALLDEMNLPPSRQTELLYEELNQKLNF